MQCATAKRTTADIPTRIYNFLNRHVLFTCHESNDGEDGNSSIQTCTKTHEIDHNCISDTIHKYTSSIKTTK